MSRSAQQGYIAIAPQVSKGTLPGSPVYYKIRATDIDFGAVEPGGLLPPEIASIVTPTGAYKMGVFAAGGFSFIPRLEADLGWLLGGLMGASDSNEDTGSIGTGKYFHDFTFDTDPTSLPWFTVHKFVPSSANMFEDVLDCKIARLRLTIPQAGPVAARLDMVGRSPTWPESPSWTEDTMDDGDSFPVAGATGAFLKLPTFSASAIAATGAIIEMTNMMTTPQQELVIGSQYPDDFVVLQRAATIRFVYKWEDPALCRAIMTGSTSGVTSWTPNVYTSDFQAKVLSTDTTALGGDEAFALQVDAAKVSWEPNGPIRLVGNNILAQEFVGTALEPASGDYFRIQLKNAETGYTWPTS